MAYVHTLILCLFVAVKAGGSAFAAWSWLWLLLPEVPVLYRLLRVAFPEFL